MTHRELIRSVVVDPENSDELLLDLGNDLCEQVGWQPGDVILWSDNGDGSWTLKKKV